MVTRSFRPLSWGLSFNDCTITKTIGFYKFSSPFLGTFFQYAEHRNDNKTLHVFVPFLGDFLSMKTTAEHMHDVADVFVPFLGDFLSIVALIISLCSILCVFVPFLGDFLSMIKRLGAALYGLIVFVPFLGDFLSIYLENAIISSNVVVFVPFLGDFLSIQGELCGRTVCPCRFSSPFLGTFFQYLSLCKIHTLTFLFSSPFLGTFFQCTGLE